MTDDQSAELLREDQARGRKKGRGGSKRRKTKNGAQEAAADDGSEVAGARITKTVDKPGRDDDMKSVTQKAAPSAEHGPPAAMGTIASWQGGMARGGTPFLCPVAIIPRSRVWRWQG